MKKIVEMPKGLVPLKFDTVEDAEIYLNNFHSNVEQLKNNKVINLARSSVGSQSATDWAGALLWVNTTVQYEYSGNIFTAVNEVDSVGEVYGPGLAWIPDGPSHYGNISSDGTQLFVHSGGTSEIYLFIEGIGRVLAVFQTFDNTFEL